MTGRKNRVAFIGLGTMGEALLKGLLQKGIIDPSTITASAPRTERRAYLTETYGITAVASNAEAIGQAATIVLCVKPQTVTHALSDIRPVIKPNQLLISILAGVSLRTLEELSGHSATIRSMPNTPANVGEGMTVWTAAHAVTSDHRGLARGIFGALGRELEVENEDYLDMATSLSGCGPAYLFLVMEALIDAGVHVGLPRYVAEELVTQTVLGAAKVAQESRKHPAALKNAVTSPGGTAAAALYQLEKGGLRSTFDDAVSAAYQRAKEIGTNKG